MAEKQKGSQPHAEGAHVKARKRKTRKEPG
jgi:hypothetical protein